MKKYTKKEIKQTLACMRSVRGPYNDAGTRDGDIQRAITNAINDAHRDLTDRELIDNAYNDLNEVMI